MPRWLVITSGHLFGVALYAASAWIAWRLWQRFPWEYGQLEVKESLYALAGDFTLIAWSVPGYVFTLLNNPAKQSPFLNPMLAGLLMGGGLQAWVYLGWIVNDWLAGFFYTKKEESSVWFLVTFILSPLLSSLAAAWASTTILRNKTRQSQ